MAAADALIAMTAQSRGAAADDGIEYLAMHPCKV
jgi:deoxycytidylate deaminase